MLFLVIWLVLGFVGSILLFLNDVVINKESFTIGNLIILLLLPILGIIPFIVGVAFCLESFPKLDSIWNKQIIPDRRK